MATNRQLKERFPNGYCMTTGRGGYMAIAPVFGGPFTYVADEVDAHIQARAKGGRLITEQELRNAQG